MSQPTIHLPMQDEAVRAGRLRTARMTAAVAGGLCMVILAGLLVSFVREQRSNILTSKTITELKQKLAERPEDEQIKERLRQVDLEVRQQHHRNDQ